MDNIFADRKLKKYANNNRLANKKLGSNRAKLFQRRLQDILDSSSFDDLKNLPGNYHQLKDNRKNQWACDLDQPYRLIFEPGENPIAINKDGKQILNQIRIVEILEIINYQKEK